MKITVTQWDESGNEIVTECEPFIEAYPGQIDEMIAGIKSGLSALEAVSIYAHPQPAPPEAAGT